MKKIITILIFFILFNQTYAFTGQSANYKLTHSNINYISARDTSTNYKIDYSLTEQPVKKASSANYKLSLGFYHKFVSKIEEIIDNLGLWGIAILIQGLYAISLAGIYFLKKYKNSKKDG